MASTYIDEKEKQQQAANTSLAASLGATTGQKAAAAPTDYTARIQQLAQQKYTPSESVMSAQSYLQSIVDNKPGSYQSKYTDQLQGLYDRILNREKFSYDMNGDLLYRQYADQYQRMGSMAMQDTMGQAAALTGGYGNSYAQTAGQQTYQGYLQQLNSMVPELANAAYNRYAQEGADLQNQYAMALAADQQDYGRHQDAYNQWAAERSFAQSAYDSAYSQDYTDYANRLNMAQQTLQMEREDAQRAEAYAREDAQRAQETAYNTAMAMIQKGVLPTAELLAAAGISDTDALELAKKYGYRAPGSGGGGGGGSKKTTTPAGTKQTEYANYNAGWAASGLDRDSYDSAVRSAYAQRTDENKLTALQQKIYDQLKDRRGF